MYCSSGVRTRIVAGQGEARPLPIARIKLLFSKKEIVKKKNKD